MSQVAEAWGREGRVVRTLRHGTVMIWDVQTRSVYPFYRGEGMELRPHEAVRFMTDTTDTIISELVRTEPPKTRKSRRIALSDIIQHGVRAALFR